MDKNITPQASPSSINVPLGYFVFFFLLFGCLPSIDKTLLDPDVLWHIAAGDLIIETRFIPATDPWSFTAGDYPWLNISWLFDIVISLTHTLQDLAGPAKAALFAMALLGALMAHVAYRYSQSIILSVLTVLLSSWCILPSMLARPHWITYLFSLSFVYLLRYQPQRVICLLPLMMLLWVNMHGGFFIGLFILGLFGLEAILTHNTPIFIRLLATGILCLIAMLANPLGSGIIEAVWRTMDSPLSAYTIEWQALRLTDPVTTVYFLLFLGTSGFFLKEIPLAERLLALSGLLLALSNGRMFAVTVCISIPYLVMALKIRLLRSPMGKAFTRKDNEYIADLSQPKVFRSIKLLTLLTALFMSLPISNRLLPETVFKLSSIHIPDKAIDYILAQHPQVKFLTHYNFGGYIIYKTRGSLPVFIDGRASTAFSPEVVKDDLIFFSSPQHEKNSKRFPPTFNELISKYAIGGVLTQRDDMLDRLLPLSGEWERVYADDVASVLVRSYKPAPASTLPTQVDLTLCPPKRVK